MTDSKVCPGCGTANTPDSRFCGRCGTGLGAPSAPQPQPVAAPKEAAPPPSDPWGVAPPSGIIGTGIEPADSKLRTMMVRAYEEGSSGNKVVPPAAMGPVASAPSAASSGGGRPPQRTMLGLAMGGPAAAPAGGGFDLNEPTTRQSPAELFGQQKNAPLPPSPAAAPPMSAPMSAPVAAPVSAPVPAASPAASRPAAKTMLGLSGPGMPGVAVAGGAVAAPVSSAVPAPTPASAAPAAFAQPVAPQAAPAAVPVAVAPAPMPAQAAAAAPPVVAPAPTAAMPSAPMAPASASASAKKLGPSHRTMLGVAAPSAPAAAGPAATPMAASVPMSTPMDTGEMSIAGMPSPRRRANGCLVAFLAVALLVAVGALGMFAYGVFVGRGPNVQASVAQTDGGEVVRLSLPDAPPGAVVRYGGTTHPVTNGAAELPLAADALHLGDNVLNVEIVSGDTTTAVPITLTLEYRVRADLEGLARAPASLAIVVEALPGASATVGGAPVPLDAQGHGRLEIPVDTLTPAADGSITHVAAYVVTPVGGQPASGTLTTRIPGTPLELRQPLEGAVTDAATLRVAGRTAAPGASPVRVSIEGQDATPGPDGVFSLEVPLPAADADGHATLHVVATRPGSAPRALAVRVRRVADLRRAAADAPVERSFGYAQLAEAPEAAQGHTVALEGQVYNADVQDGHGVLQMLVRGCTRTDRCPLWVTYAPAELVAPGAVVRVVGVANGTQQFRAESGETRTVPRVDASFVVPGP